MAEECEKIDELPDSQVNFDKTKLVITEKDMFMYYFNMRSDVQNHLLHCRFFRGYTNLSREEKAKMLVISHNINEELKVRGEK